MSTREYPHYAGREKLYGLAKKCCCCTERARYEVTIQTSWFRGDDEVYRVCAPHAGLARANYAAFSVLAAEREVYMRQTVNAKHEETGRLWKGERRALPPRYQEVPTVGNE